MKISQLRKSLWLGFIIGILILPAVYAAPIIGSQKCQLGETCRLGSSVSNTYYPVSSDTGTTYSCTIKATDSAKISARLLSYKDFTFKSQEVGADNNGITIKIKGRFTGSEGAIKIRQTAALTANGTVMCKADT